MTYSDQYRLAFSVHCQYITEVVKKQFNLNVRVAAEDWVVFRHACDSAGVGASFVIRDLCSAAVLYINEYCSRGRWYPPQLIPALPGATANALVRQAADKPSSPSYGTRGKRHP
jgi:hypothetical protein